MQEINTLIEAINNGTPARDVLAALIAERDQARADLSRTKADLYTLQQQRHGHNQRKARRIARRMLTEGQVS